MLVASRTLSHHLVLCRPLLLVPSIFPNIRVFSRESSLLMRWPKYWSPSFRICPSSEHSGRISFRMDQFDLLAVHGTLKSLLQHHNSKASILRRSAFFMVHLSLPYITVALTIRTFVGKVVSLLFKILSRFVIVFLPRSNTYMCVCVCVCVCVYACAYVCMCINMCACIYIFVCVHVHLDVCSYMCLCIQYIYVRSRISASRPRPHHVVRFLPPGPSSPRPPLAFRCCVAGARAGRGGGGVCHVGAWRAAGGWLARAQGRLRRRSLLLLRRGDRWESGFFPGLPAAAAEGAAAGAAWWRARRQRRRRRRDNEATLLLLASPRPSIAGLGPSPGGGGGGCSPARPWGTPSPAASLPAPAPSSAGSAARR
uniref:Uncharacterized protein n=1 Tax=Podarcis muralis TaxID=64176 RepID=A0A670HN33_PODMU